MALATQADHVILVDAADRPIGTEEKLKAHREGKLHRAFSVFLFNPQGQMLLQQRAFSKYHSRGCWSNTCCSHPRPGETVLAAARRRLQEEMGLSCTLHPAFQFTYQAVLEDGLIEHEYDHVLVGLTEADPQPDPDEAAGWKWADVASVRADLATQPAAFSSWFRIAFAEMEAQALWEGLPARLQAEEA